ncbi:MAG TPA: hypothetical protein PKW07_11105 [Syntrophorhabdaceae bacterium]|nr:hypothetical protein [Syntrophorhabdaceae bacterium]
MNILPFSDILMTSVSGAPSIGEKNSLEIENVKSGFAEILNKIVSGNNNLGDILSHEGKEGQITEKTLGILALQVMWQLMNKEGMEVLNPEQQQINDNLSFVIKDPNDNLNKEEIENIKKAAAELIRIMLETFSRLKDRLVKDNINIDPLVEQSSLAAENVRFNDIDTPESSMFALLTNNNKRESVPIEIDTTAFPIEAPHTDDPEPKKASHRDTVEQTTTGHENKAGFNPNDLGTGVFVPQVHMAVPYNIEVIITKGNSEEAESNGGLMDYGDVEADGWKNDVRIREIAYGNKTKETSFSVPASKFTENLDGDDPIISERIIRQGETLYARFQHNELRKIVDHNNGTLEEKIQDMRIFSRQDTITTQVIKRQEDTSYFDKDILDLTKEKLNSENEIKDKTDRHIVLDSVADKGIVRQKNEDVQANRFPEMMQKIENIVEQYSAGKKNIDMLIRFKIDDGEILQLGLKNKGEDILIQIKSTNMEIANMFNEHKEAIIKSLEEKNIFANIFVNPDGARNQEKRQHRQGHRGYKSNGGKTVDNFSDILKAQA